MSKVPINDILNISDKNMNGIWVMVFNSTFIVKLNKRTHYVILMYFHNLGILHDLFYSSWWMLFIHALSIATILTV